MPFGEDIPSGVGSRGSCYPSGLYPATPDVLSVKFTGKERDAESGLDFFGARYMASAQGRFTSPDPAGTFVADSSRPQSWNFYTYAENSPLSRVDPFGLDSILTGTTCYVDGFNTSCSGAQQLVQSGSASQCPNNVCTIATANGFLQYSSYADGVSGYVAFGTQPYEIRETVSGTTYTSFHNIFGASIDPFAIENHHIIPQQFAPLMPEGISVQDYIVQLPRYLHRLKPFGVHTGRGVQNWSGKWRQFLNEVDNSPTVRQIQQQVNKMLNLLDQHISAVDAAIDETVEEVSPIIEEVGPLL
jgi:RHS repeat-associated protein